jgi:hypothetical protein
MPPVPEAGVTRTIWLIEAPAGSGVTVVKEFEGAGIDGRFNQDGDAVLLAGKGVITEHTLDGVELGPVFQPEPCQFKAEGEQVDGRWHPTVVCSSPNEEHPFQSPDGEWFTYMVPEGDPAARPAPYPPVSSMWALNLRTSERRMLQAGLQDCGGCDGRFGPSWSPSGRYYVFAETGGEERVFLSDLDMNTTRPIANGNQLDDQPDWAPGADAIVYRSATNTAVFEDLSAGRQEELENVDWPARFDPTGEYIYSPAFGRPPQQPGFGTTTIVAASTRVVSSVLPGEPAYSGLWRDAEPIVAAGQLVAALTRSPDCDGTLVYIDGVPLNCVVGAEAATVSPDGSKIALARITETSGSGSSTSMNKYEIVLVDVASGDESVAATGAQSMESPHLTWNSRSTHLLVTWPVYGGL